MSGTATQFTATLQSYRIVSTRAGGDNLQDIAARELGDATQWPALAYINGLVPPYITTRLDKVGPGVIFAGTAIKVPGNGTTANGVADTDAVLGTDALLQNGLLTANAAGDIATVSGVPNLEQAVSNRLATHTGDLVFYLQYGCEVYELIGQGAGPATDQLAAALVEKSVLGDPRIANTSTTTASVTGDTVSIQGSAVSVTGRAVPVGLPSTPSTATAPNTPPLS